MKIMTFNLKHRIKEDLFGTWRKRYVKIISYINKEDPDIIGVQELSRKGKRYLKRNLKQYKIVGKRRHSIIFTNEYNCLLIKNDYKINGHKTYSLSDNINKLGRKAKQDNFPRICTVAHIEKDGIKYFVANTHMDNSSTENKKRLLGIFESILNRYKKVDEYIIITGDFNMTLDNKNLYNFSLNYLDPFKDHPETSFPSISDIKSIDHIFLDKRFNYSNEKIHENSNDDGHMSDHYPLTCEITIRE